MKDNKEKSILTLLPPSIIKLNPMSVLNRSRSTMSSTHTFKSRIGSSIHNGDYNDPSMPVSLCYPKLVNLKDRKLFNASLKYSKPNKEINSMNRIKTNHHNSYNKKTSFQAFSNNYSCLQYNRKSNTLLTGEKAKIKNCNETQMKVGERKGLKESFSKKLNGELMIKEASKNNKQIVKTVFLDCNSVKNRQTVNKMNQLYTCKQLGLAFLQRKNNNISNSTFTGRNKEEKQSKIIKLSEKCEGEEMPNIMERQLNLSTYDVNDDYIKSFYRMQYNNINEQLNKENNTSIHKSELLIKNSIMMNKLLDAAINF